MYNGNQSIDDIYVGDQQGGPTYIWDYVKSMYRCI